MHSYTMQFFLKQKTVQMEQRGKKHKKGKDKDKNERNTPNKI